MTASRNPADIERAFAELRRRIDQLETQAILEFASIDAGQGIAVRIPDGIEADDLKIGTTGGVGSVKAGTTELTKDGVGSGGAKIFSDGKIGRDDGGELATKGAFAVDGNLVVIGTVDGRGGVYTPWEGAKGTVESIMGGIKTTAENAASAASTADSKAGTAQARADSAWDLANGRVTQTELSSAIGGVKAELESALTKIRNVYNAHIDTYHPGGGKMTG